MGKRCFYALRECLTGNGAALSNPQVRTVGRPSNCLWSYHARLFHSCPEPSSSASESDLWKGAGQFVRRPQTVSQRTAIVKKDKRPAMTCCCREALVGGPRQGYCLQVTRFRRPLRFGFTTPSPRSLALQWSGMYLHTGQSLPGRDKTR